MGQTVWLAASPLVAGVRREAPDPGKTLPAWLTTALRDLWTGTRPAAPLQLGLFG